ncbi:hypothetical protein LIA77_08239 [Sarocladium implicatum]|nr:hypothetical protein LIA77_08239 [Sarocladium implicatum]
MHFMLASSIGPLNRRSRTKTHFLRREQCAAQISRCGSSKFVCASDRLTKRNHLSDGQVWVGWDDVKKQFGETFHRIRDEALRSITRLHGTIDGYAGGCTQWDEIMQNEASQRHCAR